MGYRYWQKIRVLVLALIIVINMPLPMKPAIANPGITVSLIPASKTVSPGETFTIGLNIDSDAETRGLGFNLSFNASLLRCNKITKGSYYDDFARALGSGATVMLFPTNPNSKINNDTGKIGTDSDVYGAVSISVLGGPPVTPSNPARGAVGNGTVFTLEFTAKQGGEGIAEIEITRVKVTNQLSQLIDDSLVTVKHATVAVGQAAQPADLEISAVSQHWLQENSTYNITYTVKNRGSGAAEASNTAIYIDGALIAKEPCPELAAGASDSRTAGPFMISDDRDEIEIRADGDNTVAESNENNNSKTSIWSIILKPDLIVSSFKESWVVKGSKYNITYTIKNQGTGNAPTTSTAIIIDGKTEKTENCPALSVNATDTKTVGPFTISGDSDEIKIQVDKENEAAESDEGNNTSAVITLRAGDGAAPGPDGTTGNGAASSGKGNNTQSSSTPAKSENHSSAEPGEGNQTTALSSAVSPGTSQETANGSSQIVLPPPRPPMSHGLTLPWEAVGGILGAILVSVMSLLIIRIYERRIIG